MAIHELTRLTIHHTGTPSNPNRSLEDKLKGLQAFSQREDKLDTGAVKRKWGDIPYHYYIAVDGRIGEGRELKYAGDTNTSYNPTGHLLVVVEGNFMVEVVPDVQWKSLLDLSAWLCETHRLSPNMIETHKDFATTDCPGDDLYRRMPDLVQEVKRRTRARP